MNKKISILALIFTTLIGCEKDSKFPEVKNLSEYNHTQFIPTLENQISRNENSVYCATLLFAWNEIRNQINAPLTISEEYSDLILFNNSKSFMDVLKPEEYKVSGEIDGEMVKAYAEFSKSLPLEIKLTPFTNKLTFDGKKVSSFGLDGSEEHEVFDSFRIVYYKNDDNFIVQLFPKDKEHEIILFKSEKDFNSIAEMNTEIKRLTEIGNLERQDERINWRYFWWNKDELIIPKFKFNIETDFNSLIGSRFNTDSNMFTITKAWQRTAFILDENGAEIESEATLAVETATAEEEEIEREIPQPKKMIFDKEFLILLKRKEAENPYFGLWTTNTELMILE